MIHRAWLHNAHRHPHADQPTTVHSSLHPDDFPSSPAVVAEAFASLPDGARVLGNYEGYGAVHVEWQEPPNEADLERLADEAKAAAERAEFEAWMASR